MKYTTCVLSGILVTTALLVMAFSPSQVASEPKHVFVPVTTSTASHSKTQKIAVKVKKRKVSRRQGDLRAFMNRMAKIESDNNPRATNRYGMLGKYQFSPRTLRKMGVVVSREDYLSNEELQDSTMIMYLRENNRILRRIIQKYDGTVYQGVPITRSGILASAHLVGHGGVWSFFSPDKYDYATSDANGTSVGLYMKRFANYNLEL